MKPMVSIVLPTYNRCDALPAAIRSVLDQTAPPDTYDLIVANNNSTDATGEILDTYARSDPARVRTVLVRQQGVSHARNAGIALARAPILAFFDDDVRVSREWVETILRVMREHPGVDCVGGRVLPAWCAPPPAWLTRDHWAPLALQDFGDEPFLLDASQPRGLITANLACRRRLFTHVGGFAPAYQRVKDGIGSLEDEEWMRRVWKAGGRARYVPDLVVTAEVPAARLTRAYHRRWHQGHGRFCALLRAEEFERTSIGRFLDVPAHFYRAALNDVTAGLGCCLSGRFGAAFLHETRLRFFLGFLAQRLRERRGRAASPVPVARRPFW